MNKETTKIIADKLIEANMGFDILTLDDKFKIKIYNKDKKTFWLIDSSANAVFIELHKIGNNVFTDGIIDFFRFDYDEFCSNAKNTYNIITSIIHGDFSDKYKHHKTFVCEICGEVHRCSETHYALADIDGTVLPDKYICAKCTIHHNPYKVFDKTGLVPAYTCDSIVNEIKTYNYVKHMMD